MSAVRRHLLKAIALVVVLAVGIALGSGPLSHEQLLPAAQDAPRPETRPDDGPTLDDLAGEVAPALYGARLEGRTVAILTTPGVDRQTVGALTDGIVAADGAVSAHWSAGTELTGASEKVLVDTLGSQLLEQLDGAGADAKVNGYERMGQLIGTAIASTDPAGEAPGQQSLTIRSSIGAASLLSREGGGEPRKAPLVLVVLGDDLDDHVVGPLVEGIAARATGTVVAAPDRDGDLTVVGPTERTSTVDGVDTATGRLAAVLALARVAEEPGGSFGASGEDAIVPLG